MGRNSLVLLLSVLLVILLSPVCFAYQNQPPKRIAILPVLTPYEAAAPELESYLYRSLQKELHVPLNGTLKAVEYIPPEEIRAAIASLGYDGQQLQDPACLRHLAEKLAADLTVTIVLKDYYEYQFHSLWDDETWLRSYIALQLVGYDRIAGKDLKFNASKYYYDEYSPSGTLPELTQEAMSDLLQKAQLKKFIFPLSQPAAAA